MKNLLRSTLYLLAFASAGIFFQISCSADSSNASPSATGKLVYTKGGGSGIQIWVCNYDGTNQAQVPIILPANTTLNYIYSSTMVSGSGNEAEVKISPDGQTLFFETVTDAFTPSQHFSIYSCDLSGANLTEVVNGGSSAEPVKIESAF